MEAVALRNQVMDIAQSIEDTGNIGNNLMEITFA
jgi:hypothetical protein